MLSTLRENLKALSWLLWLTVASFVIAIFVDWGRAGDAARADATANWVARVNGESIAVTEFTRALRTLDQFYRQIYRDQYDPRALGIARQALDQLVRERVILDEARKMGLRVTSEEISAQITSNPGFQRDGSFIGVGEYQSFLQSRGIDVAAFEADVSRGLLREKYQRLVTDGISVTAEEVLEDYRRRNEKVTAEYLLLRTEDFLSDEPASEDELRAFFESRPDDYQSPERRRAAYVVIDPDQLPDADTVGDEEARQYYEENLERLYSTQEQVRASHILIRIADGGSPDEEEEARAAAQEIRDRLDTGEEFAALAESYSEDETNASLGGDLGFFPRGRMVGAFDEVAFSLPVAGLSGVVQTQFGFHIIKVKGRREASTRPFAEVREPILRQLRFSAAQEALREAVAAFRAAVEADPGEFDRAASRLGLEVHDTGVVDDGAAVAEIGDYPQVQQSLFRTEVGQVSSPVTLPQGTLFLRVTEVLPPQRVSFSEARTGVLEDFRRHRALESLRRRSREAGAGDLAALAGRLGADVETTTAFRRLEPVEPLTTEARELAFQLEPGQLSEGVEVAEGLLFLQVIGREGFDLDEFEGQRAVLERSLVQRRRDRLFNAVVDRLEKSSRIQVNQARLDQYEGRGA